MDRVFRQVLVAFVGVAGCLGACVAKASAPSPFMPPSSAKPAGTTPDGTLDAIQLSGISIIGDEQRFNLVDTRAKRSFWIDLRGSENGISVENYNPEDDSIVVRHGATTKRLELRRSVIISVVPAAPPLPGSDLPGVPQPPEIPAHVVGVDEIANPKEPQQVKQAEFEARMLVSDLLEISIRERARQKALREQQRQ